ncbi:MAG: hypothetical protein Roseis2KO_32930 [Roseivirga sp.]
MEEKIIELIRNRTEFPLTAFKNVLPEISGEYDFHFPTEGVDKSNILLVSHVTEEFMSAINNLIDKKVLSIEPCDFHVVAFDSGEIYDLPLVKGKRLQYKRLHWLPLLIKKGPQFR